MGLMEVFVILAFLGVVAFVIWIVMTLTRRTSDGTRICERCAGTLGAAQRVCNFCGHDLSDPALTDGARRRDDLTTRRL